MGEGGHSQVLEGKGDGYRQNGGSQKERRNELRPRDKNKPELVVHR